MKRVVLLVLFILPFTGFGQIWEKVYGGLNNQEGQSVKQTNDGGYIVVGITDATSAAGRDVWLLKNK